MLEHPLIADHPHGITTIDADFHWPGMAASHLVVDDGRAAFIDVGTSHTTPRLLQVLADKGLTPESVDWVLPTHVHLDHAGGAGTLLRALPNARMVVHPRGARHLIDPSRLIAGATAIYGTEEMERTYGEIAPAPAERVVEAPDGFEVTLGRRTLRFLDTPGHARHHYCVWDQSAGAVFTGDSFGLGYRFFETDKGRWMVPTTSPVHFDPAAMHATFSRLAELGADSAYLTHWGRLRDPHTHLAALKRRLDATVALAEEAALQPAETARDWLVAALWAYYIDDLRAWGVTLPETDLRRLLEVDVALNADGMRVWLDRR
jgi:glyoxylase-like metal-dependent hydrolase (beta-lactamase superfamily II)